MSLECVCGWVGIDLMPDYAMDVSQCPMCGKVFAGILAKDAEHYHRDART